MSEALKNRLSDYHSKYDAKAIRHAEMVRPLDYLDEPERSIVEGQLRTALAARGLSERYDALAERLGFFAGAAFIAFNEPVVNESQPAYLGGPLANSWVAYPVEAALDLMLDDQLDPERLGRDLARAKAACERAQPATLAAKYEAAREAQRQNRREQRLIEWTMRPLLTRALVRLAAEEPAVSTHAEFLRRIAAAVEAESILEKKGQGKGGHVTVPLPPDDWDRRPLIPPAGDTVSAEPATATTPIVTAEHPEEAQL